LILKRSITPEQWIQFSKYNKDRADAEMNASKRLRENIQQTMAQSSSDLEAQKNATEFAMRRRIHETQQAREELEWQKKRVKKIKF
jgi:tektin-2